MKVASATVCGVSACMTGSSTTVVDTGEVNEVEGSSAVVVMAMVVSS